MTSQGMRYALKPRSSAPASNGVSPPHLSDWAGNEGRGAISASAGGSVDAQMTDALTQSDASAYRSLYTRALEEPGRAVRQYASVRQEPRVSAALRLTHFLRGS